MKVTTQLDLLLTPLLNLRLENRADRAFAAGEKGAVWIDGAGNVRVNDGTNIATLRSALTALVNGDIAVGAAIDPAKINGTAVVNSDARLTNARTPSGTAGGSLSGSYPNPGIAAGAISATEIAAALKGGAAAGTEALRALGTTATTAAAGNDARLSDARTPLAHTHTAAQITDLATALNARTISSFLAATAPVSFGGFRATNLAAPTADNDAATKAYVDAAVQGLQPKRSVVAATNAPVGTSVTNGTLSLSWEDGLKFSGAASVGDRVLIKDASNPAHNGIWVMVTASSGIGFSSTYTRAADADTWNELVAAFVFVEADDTGWLSTADSGGTLGTTALPWTQFSSAGQILAGAGLAKDGNTLSIANLGVIAAMLANNAVTGRAIKPSLTISQGSEYAYGLQWVNNANNADGRALSLFLHPAAPGLDYGIPGSTDAEGISLYGLKIADEGVTTARLAPNAATAAKIASDVAGNGLTKGTGSSPISLALDNSGSGLELTGTSPNQTLGIADLGVSGAMLATGAVDLAGTKVGSNALPVAKGGTASTTAAGARTALGAVGKYASATHAAVAAGGSITIAAATHALGATMAIQVVARQLSTGEELLVDNTVSSAGVVTVGPFAQAQAANSIHVTCVG